MLDFLNSYQIPFMVVMTKVDKLAKSKVPQAASVIARELGIRKEMIIPFSSETSVGKENLLSYIESVIEE